MEKLTGCKASEQACFSSEILLQPGMDLSCTYASSIERTGLLCPGAPPDVGLTAVFAQGTAPQSQVGPRWVPALALLRSAALP